jgi:type 2 lantibiotic biosynthesis protein LanM
VTASKQETQTAFTDEQRRELAGRARTLFERLGGPENERGETPIDIDETFEQWESALGESLSERLARDGVGIDQARAAATATQWPSQRPLPEWISLIEDLAVFLTDQQGETIDDGEAFAAFHAAVAAFGRSRLEIPTDSEVTDTAVDGAEAWLRSRIARLSTRILYVEFKTFVAREDEGLAFADPSTFDDPPTERYEQFIEGLLGDGFRQLCLEYPVYGRLLATRVEQWWASFRELFDRLDRDRPDLAERFNDGEPLGPVVELEPLADDTHGDGRAVVAVTFESGTRVVYKPRPIEGMVSFYRMLDRFDPHLSVPSFEQPTWLQRDGYGYVEWIEYQNVPDEAAASRYYQRVGAFVCLAYAFEFEDCHFENLITAGEQPMLVDGETFLAPYADPSTREVPSQIAPVIDETVHTSMLLPFGIDLLGHEGELGQAGMSGVGIDSEPVKLTSVTRPRIEAPNTDVMTVVQESPSFKRATNTLQLGDQPRPPAEHTEDLVDGFTETYRTIRRLRETDRLFGDVLDESLLAGVETRFVYRATQQYASVVRSSSSRDCLRDGVAFSVTVDTALATSFTDGTIEDDRLWELYESERTALRRLDPPRITGTTDTTKLSFDSNEIGVQVDQAGYERANNRIEALSEIDERVQRRLIYESVEETPAAGTVTDGSLYTAAPVNPRGDGATVTSTDSEQVPNASQIERAASTLFDTIVTSRSSDFRQPDGWVVLDSGGIGATQVRLTDGSLRMGTPGIAVATGAYACLADDQRANDLATTFGEVLAEREDWPEKSHGIVEGAGARVYALSVLGQLFDDRFYDSAVAQLDGIPAIDGSAATVSSGLAGTALAAVACYDSCGADTALEVAQRCGEELRQRVDTGQLPSEYGFEDGRVGIAYALARLGTIDTTYTDTAERVVETLPSSVVTATDRPVVTRLGLLGLSRYLDSVESPVPPTVPEDGYDHLWGGRAAVVEHAVTAGRDLTEGCSLTEDVRLPGHVDTLPNPTLFTGLSGVVYTLCRMSEPETIPSVALFESVTHH